MAGTLEKQRFSWADLGIWVGADPPARFVTYAQWLANPGSGYFSWIDISTGVRAKEIAAPYGHVQAGVGTPLIDLTNTIDLAALYGALAVAAGTATLDIMIPSPVDLAAEAGVVQPGVGTPTVSTGVMVVLAAGYGAASPEVGTATIAVQGRISLASDFGAIAAAVGTPTLATQARIALASAYGAVAPGVGTAAVEATTTLDVTAPSISSFSVPATASSTSLTGISAAATDAVGVTGWVIKDVAGGASAPTATASECTQTTGISGGSLSSSALTHTAGGTGARDFYLFARDAAGNVATSSASTCTISVGGITHVGEGALFAQSKADGATFTVGLPAGISQNDILLLILGGGSYSTVEPPTGWADVATTNFGANSSGFSAGSVYWKRAGESETDPTCTAHGDDGEGPVPTINVARIVGFRGCAASGSPIDVAGVSASGTGTSITGSARTTATANAMVILAGGYAGASITYSTPGVSVDAVVSGSSASGSCFLAYDDAPSNSPGPKSAPTAAASPSAGWSVITFALKPA